MEIERPSRFKLFFLLSLLAAFSILTVVFLMDASDVSHFSSAQGEPVAQDAQAFLLPVSEPSLLPILNPEVPQPAIDAKAFMVYDVRASKVLWERNSQLKLPVASLTKVLSSLVILEHANLEDIVTVPQSAVRVDEERQDLSYGERMSVENLLTLMLIDSSNDAAYALADHIQKTRNIDVVQKMNEKALSIGMYDSYFMDPAGLDDNAFSTTSDMMKLIHDSLQYQKVWDILTTQEATIYNANGTPRRVVRNTNQLLGIIPNIFGGKTGNTPKALGCMLLIVDIPEYRDKIIAIVLSSHDRFGDMEKIITWTKAAYRWK